MSSSPDPYEFPDGLPVPTDDGACGSLTGKQIPRVRLEGSDHRIWDLEALASSRAVFYVYPATGVPGQDPIPGWDRIPGAPGCTLQSLGYRDRYPELVAQGFSVVGISAQDVLEQREFALRNRISFPLLSDSMFLLHDRLGLPMFEAEGRRFYRRLAMAVENGVIRHVMYPVFPPARNADVMLDWIRSR